MRNKFLVVPILAAIVLRLAFVLFYPHPVMSSDSYEYHQIAVNLIQGHGYAIVPDVPTARRAPGYPLFLAGMYSLFGTGTVPVEVAQSLIAALTCLLAYFLTRDVFGERPARVVLVSLALYPILIAYCGLILTETLFTFFLMLGALCFVRAFRSKSLKDFFLLGVVFGITFLIRSDVILLPFIIVAILFIAWRNRLQTLYRFAILLTGTLIPFIPWGIYSYTNFHCIFPGHSGALGALVRTSAGYAMMGTTEFNVESWKKLDDYFRKMDAYAHPEQTEKRLFNEGIGIIVRNPSKFAMLLVHRFPKFWITSHSAVLGMQRTNKEYLQEHKYHILIAKTLLLALHVLILSAAFLGFFATKKNSGEVFFLSVLFAYPMLYLFIDIACRHHIPYMPYFFIFAAAGLLSFWDRCLKSLTPGEN